MAGAQMRSASQGAGTIAFELERFEVDDERRIEVVGRWFGVRGRRFVRPTLSFDAGQGWQRALADLEHKPWAPEEGEPWIATFKLDLPDDAGQAELAVAPDIAVDLPAPRQPGRRRSGRRATPTLVARTDPPRVDNTGSRAPGSPNSRRPAADPRAELAEARTEIERLRETRDAAYQRLAGERDALAAAQVELKQARAADADVAAGEAEEELRRALTDRDRATAQRDEARAELRRVAAERDAAASERDDARSERDAASERRDSLADERRALRRERDGLESERAAVAARQESLAREREELRREREDLRRQGDRLKRVSEESAEVRDALARDCQTLAARRERLAEDVAALGTTRDGLADERETLNRELEDLRESMRHGSGLAMPSPADAAAVSSGVVEPPAYPAARDRDSAIERSRRSSQRWLVLAALCAAALALVLVVRLSM